jgi:hypothetical protein
MFSGTSISSEKSGVDGKGKQQLLSMAASSPRLGTPQRSWGVSQRVIGTMMGIVSDN